MFGQTVKPLTSIAATAVFVLAMFVMLASPAKALSSPDALIQGVRSGKLTKAMTERGYVWIKMLPRVCHWSNADAEYRARSLARKLENLMNAVDGSPEEQAEAVNLYNTINKSSMYQDCWSAIAGGFEVRPVPIKIYEWGADRVK